MKTASAFQKIAFRVLTIILTGFLTAQFVSAQGWQYSFYLYRVPITVTNNNTGDPLENFQVQVNLDNTFPYWNQIKNDGSDIRFSAMIASVQTEIPYWIESYDETVTGSEHASIWIRLPSIPAHDGTDPGTITVYMYYGFSESTSASNGFSTFEFFDDFETTATVPSTERWTVDGGTWTIVDNGYPRDGKSGRVVRGVMTDKQILKSVYSGLNYIVEGYGLQHLGNTWGLGIRTTNRLNGYSLNLYSNHNTDGTDNLWLYRWCSVAPGNIGVWHTHVGNIYRDQWYKTKIVARGTDYDLYLNDVLRGTGTDATFSSGAMTLYGESGTNALFDDVRVRQYAALEPSSGSPGTRQNNPCPPLTVSVDGTSKTGLSCFGDADGTIDITIAGGTAPYNCSWEGPTGYTSGSEDISGLVVGTYILTVTDAGCSSGYITVEITQPNILTAGYAVISPIYCTTGQATVQISASGGTPPYTGTGDFMQSVGTTVYSVHDSNGCTEDVSVTIDGAESWFNPAWKYRKQVDVPNTPGTELVQFQVKVALGSTFDFDKAKSDGSDIRFTSSDGTTPLPYWIEQWDTEAEQAMVWVKVPSIPIAGTNIYLYYGNEAAENAESGDDTFEFFDDFELAETKEGYWDFGQPSTIMVRDRAWETSAPHTLSVVKAPVGADYTYHGYYGPQGSGWIAMAGSNDLQNWTKFSSPVNPLFSGHQERWPSVVLYNGVYYMVHTMGYGAPSYLVYRSSNDGLTWSEPTTIIQDSYNNQNPSLYHDPVSGKFYVYWFRREGDRRIMVREAETVAGLVSAPNIELLRSSATLAAPNVLYYGGIYFLSTEIYPDNVWQVRIYSGPSPTGPFTMLPGNPVLGEGCACLFQHLIDEKIYEYYCKETGSTWTLDMRIVDPTEGRIIYDQAILDDGKWTSEGGTWDVVEATQQDGSLGNVAQGSTTASQILKSSFSGTDFVLEGIGRQISNRVWGLGFRTTDAANGYTLNLYEDLDATNNLYFYRWPSGGTGDRWHTGVGPIELNEWHKLSIQAHGNEFDVYFNNEFKATVTDDTHGTGSIALFGEAGVTAQFDDIRVRKYASADPLTSLNIAEEIWEPSHQWTGAADNDWSNLANWCGGSVPDETTDVVITSSAVRQPRITSDPYSPSECYNLMVSGGSNVTIGSGTALTVQGGLTVEGTLTVESSPYSDVAPVGLTSNGSLIVKGGSTGAITYNRFLRPNDNLGDLHFFASPVGGQSIASFIEANRDNINPYETGYEIWKWYEESLTANWLILSPSGTFESGIGYSIDQADLSNGLLTFTGSVVNSASVRATSPYADYNGNPRATAFDYGRDNVDPLLWAPGRSWTNYGGGGWNLMGNPFTSAMDAAAFVTENTGRFDPNYQALYIYDGTSNGGEYKFAAMEVPGPIYDDGGFFSQNIQVGQGFFVLALYNDIDFNFTPDMQVHNTTVTLLKSAATDDAWPGLQLKVRSGENERATTIVYNDEMTTGIDPGYDVGLLSTGPEVEIYTALALHDNSVNFTRQALPVSGADNVSVPIGIDTEKGGEVTFSALSLPLGDKKYWLEDRTTGIYTDLTTKSYTVNLPSKTYGTGRFFIIASTNTPTGIDPLTMEESGLRIWQAYDKVVIKGEVNEKALCEIYDINGKMLLRRSLTDNSLNTIDLPQNLRGVVLVRVIDGPKVTTQKVAIL